MDCWVWTNRFSGTTPGDRYIGSKSGYLDPASFVSFSQSARARAFGSMIIFKGDCDGIADVNHLAPCTRSTQKGRIACWSAFDIHLLDYIDGLRVDMVI